MQRSAQHSAAGALVGQQLRTLLSLVSCCPMSLSSSSGKQHGLIPSQKRTLKAWHMHGLFLTGCEFSSLLTLILGGTRIATCLCSYGISYGISLPTMTQDHFVRRHHLAMTLCASRASILASMFGQHTSSRHVTLCAHSNKRF